MYLTKKSDISFQVNLFIKIGFRHPRLFGAWIQCRHHRCRWSHLFLPFCSFWDIMASMGWIYSISWLEMADFAAWLPPGFWLWGQDFLVTFCYSSHLSSLPVIWRENYDRFSTSRGSAPVEAINHWIGRLFRRWRSCRQSEDSQRFLCQMLLYFFLFSIWVDFLSWCRFWASSPATSCLRSTAYADR